MCKNFIINILFADIAFYVNIYFTKSYHYMQPEFFIQWLALEIISFPNGNDFKETNIDIPVWYNANHFHPGQIFFYFQNVKDFLQYQYQFSFSPREIVTVLHTYSSFLKQLIGEAVVFILKMSERTSAPFGVWRLKVQRTWEQTISGCKHFRKKLIWTSNLDIYCEWKICTAYTEEC